MSLRRLITIIVALAGAIGLALSNPTMDDYLRFVEQELSKAIDRMDQGHTNSRATIYSAGVSVAKQEASRITREAEYSATELGDCEPV